MKLGPSGPRVVTSTSRIARFALPAARSIVDGEEIFAIGDVHGFADELEGVLSAIGALPRLAARRRLIFLGDLIDRGPNSLRALDLAMEGGRIAKADVTTSLWGNHEIMLSGAIDEAIPHHDRRDFFECWARNGGDRVLHELDPFIERRRGVNFSAAIGGALGEKRVAFLRERVSHHRSGDVIFVHAGLPPDRSHAGIFSQRWNRPLLLLDENAHWAWTRWPFLLPEGHPNGLHRRIFVVHGHTMPDVDPLATPRQIECGRLNLDGGTYSRDGAIRWARFVGRNVDLFGDVALETRFALERTRLRPAMDMMA